jgi:phage tail-like protein
MSYDIKKDVPQHLLKYEDTVKLLEIFQHGVDLINEDIDGYTEQFDLETCEEQYLDLMLFESGWNVDIEFNTNLKRKIVKIAYYIYNQKGIENGIEFALEYLTGLAVQVNDTVKEGFVLGKEGYPPENSLGDDTELGFGGFYLHFIVHTEPLVAEQLTFITKMTDFMRWAVNTFEIRQDLGHSYHEISSSPNEFVPTSLFYWGSFFVNYSIDIESDGILYQVVFTATEWNLWSDVVLEIQSKLRLLTGGLETVTIVDNKIRVSSATYGGESTIVLSNGTKPGIKDFVEFLDGFPNWNPVFETPVSGEA